MPCVDNADDVPSPDALDQLRHDLKTPLTTIHARAQLLGRAIRRSPSLTDDEQARMLESLATIDEAVRTMVTVIDAMGRDSANGSSDSTG
jgi:signal transduction histidine kinase